MNATTYVRRARAVIRAHGVFFQAVCGSDDVDPDYCYTIGLSHQRIACPELIVFGLDLSCGAALLETVAHQVRTSGPLRPGQILTGPLVPDAPGELRVDAVRPEWVQAYAGLGPMVLDRSSPDVPMVQLVSPDRFGRWPEDPDVDPALSQSQPLLARDFCWQAPIRHTGAEDLFQTAEPPAALVAVPVHRAGVAQGRYELLRAVPGPFGTTRIADVPWAADHVTFGDLVQTVPAGSIPGLPEQATVMDAMFDQGPWMARAFALPLPGTPERDMRQLGSALWHWIEIELAWLSTSATMLHVNTADLGEFDARARPFVRDGLLVPRPLYSELDLFPSAMTL